jgi:hypothetical protein
MVLERWTNPNVRGVRVHVSMGCNPCNRVEGNRRAGKRPRERFTTRKPQRPDSRLVHRCTSSKREKEETQYGAADERKDVGERRSLLGGVAPR